MRRGTRLAAVVALLASLLVVVPSGQVLAATVVSTYGDSGTGSLRAAAAGSTITFGVSCPSETPITLGSALLRTVGWNLTP